MKVSLAEVDRKDFMQDQDFLECKWSATWRHHGDLRCAKSSRMRKMSLEKSSRWWQKSPNESRMWSWMTLRRERRTQLLSPPQLRKNGMKRKSGEGEREKGENPRQVRGNSAIAHTQRAPDQPNNTHFEESAKNSTATHPRTTRRNAAFPDEIAWSFERAATTPTKMVKTSITFALEHTF